MVRRASSNGAFPTMPCARRDRSIAWCHDGRSLMWSRMRLVGERDGEPSIIERISGADMTAVVCQTAPSFAHTRLDCADCVEPAGQRQYAEQSQKG
jgi:hypothetical protein